MLRILEIIHKFVVLAGIIALIIVLFPSLIAVVHALNGIAHFMGG